MLRYVPLLARLEEPQIRAALTGRYEARLSNALGEVGSGFPALDFLSSIGSFADGHVFFAAYVGAHGYLGRERKKARVLRRELGREDPEGLKGEECAEPLRIVRCGTEDISSEEGSIACGRWPPSRSRTTDTLGQAVAEAQASGLQAVVCGIGGPRECIQSGVSGFVVDSGDEAEFFSTIELLLDDAEVRERMALAAREFAAGMSWQAVQHGLIELHSRLAGATRTAEAPLGSWDPRL